MNVASMNRCVCTTIYQNIQTVPAASAARQRLDDTGKERVRKTKRAKRAVTANHDQGEGAPRVGAPWRAKRGRAAGSYSTPRSEN